MNVSETEFLEPQLHDVSFDVSLKDTPSVLPSFFSATMHWDSAFLDISEELISCIPFPESQTIFITVPTSQKAKTVLMNVSLLTISFYDSKKERMFEKSLILIPEERSNKQHYRIFQSL
eukprot:gnl/Dysnectes_brevis/3757_a4823_901.p2 GENE.gnl/Dysnectes_brevis/3757_a4823_901~~gnl/Dysnectes_brevis/3757_a4823_901.p2  ORF type:complete len:119 (+),score=11.93 gnl/Dysnectes_brevis/3757_a4823_901:769-1125(+)